MGIKIAQHGLHINALTNVNNYVQMFRLMSVVIAKYVELRLKESGKARI